jgi:hypothetical protein
VRQDRVRAIFGLLTEFPLFPGSFRVEQEGYLRRPAWRITDAAHAHQAVRDREVTYEPATAAVTAVSGANDMRVSRGLSVCSGTIEAEATEVMADGFPTEGKFI